MKNVKLLLLLLIAVLLMGLGAFATTTQAAPAPQAASVTLKTLNPQGNVPQVNKFAPRLSTLDGKTVALYLMMPSTYEFQPAGVAFYKRMTELLTKQFPNVKLIQPDKLDNAPEVKAAEPIKTAKADAAILGIGG